MESETSNGKPENPRELIDRTETSWRAWVTATDGIPEDRMRDAMVGHWTPKDLLGHVAFWEDYGIGDCQRILAGEPKPAAGADPANQDEIETNRAASVSEQYRLRDEAHARLAAFLATIGEDEPHFPQLVKALEGETYDHYDEHTAEVRAWREREGI